MSSTADLVLDLSLASSFPIGVEGTNLFRGTASVKALAYRTENMDKHELREFEHTVGPLLGLLVNDINHPIACKASQAITALIMSRTCLARFVECDGIALMAKVLDQLLSTSVDLYTVSDHRSIVENLAVVYREASQYYENQVVAHGAIRHCVRMINYGDPQIRGIAASTLAILSNDLEIVQQLFFYGAIKPILNLCDNESSSEAEILAAMGCIVQLSRIPEIAEKVVKQGALPILEKELHSTKYRTSQSMRNKALLSLAWLSRVRTIQQVIATESVYDGMQRELESDDQSNQTLVLQMMINLRNVESDYGTAFTLAVRDRVLELMGEGQWFARNLTTKTLVLIYSDPDTKKYCAENGALEHIFNLIQSKNLDLQEVPLVALLAFCTHPDIPFMILDKKGHEVLAQVLYAVSEVIRDLAIVILKALYLYDRERTIAVIPFDREHLMKADPDSDPVVYGSEYGGQILEYLQLILDNRREMKYLLENFNTDVQHQENISDEELEKFQITFMELDYDCNGALAFDEIKVLMVVMGEKMDEEEIQLLFNEYDEDASGELSFEEFCVMMKNWRERFGTGAAKIYNEAIQRGAIGKGLRAFDKWWNRDEIAKQEIAKMKEDKRKAEELKQREMEKHMGAEKLRVQREMALKMLEQKQMGEYDSDDEHLPDI